jgi:hypothetical protein
MACNNSRWKAANRSSRRKRRRRRRKRRRRRSWMWRRDNASYRSFVFMVKQSEATGHISKQGVSDPLDDSVTCQETWAVGTTDHVAVSYCICTLHIAIQAQLIIFAPRQMTNLRLNLKTNRHSTRLLSEIGNKFVTGVYKINWRAASLKSLPQTDAFSFLLPAENMVSHLAVVTNIRRRVVCFYRSVYLC